MVIWANPYQTMGKKKAAESGLILRLTRCCSCQFLIADNPFGFSLSDKAQADVAGMQVGKGISQEINQDRDVHEVRHLHHIAISGQILRYRHRRRCYHLWRALNRLIAAGA